MLLSVMTRNSQDSQKSALLSLCRYSRSNRELRVCVRVYVCVRVCVVCMCVCACVCDL